MSDRLIVVSTDCHAGLPPERYRDYVSPQHRETFDLALPLQLLPSVDRSARSSPSRAIAT